MANLNFIRQHHVILDRRREAGGVLAVLVNTHLINCWGDYELPELLERALTEGREAVLRGYGAHTASAMAPAPTWVRFTWSASERSPSERDALSVLQEIAEEEAGYAPLLR